MLSKNKRFRETHLGNHPKSAAMADSSERKHALKLSLFVGLADSFASESTTARSPRCFDNGAVGLGIVAAMSKTVGDARAPAPALSRTEPIPIVPARPLGAGKQRKPTAKDEEDEELSESYTCVISHVRGNPVTKRVYFGDGFRGVDGNYRRNSGVFFESPLPPPRPPATELLKRCSLCHKELHGLDVFMYRGEKAFCSVECRCQQILSDEHREKCGSEESPCSTPLPFAPGLIAA